MNNSKRVKCYIKNGRSSKRCLLNGVHTDNDQMKAKHMKGQALSEKVETSRTFSSYVIQECGKYLNVHEETRNIKKLL